MVRISNRISSVDYDNIIAVSLSVFSLFMFYLHRSTDKVDIFLVIISQ